MPSPESVILHMASSYKSCTITIPEAVALKIQGIKDAVIKIEGDAQTLSLGWRKGNPHIRNNGQAPVNNKSEQLINAIKKNDETMVEDLKQMTGAERSKLYRYILPPLAHEGLKEDSERIIIHIDNNI